MGVPQLLHTLSLIRRLSTVVHRPELVLEYVGTRAAAGAGAADAAAVDAAGAASEE